MTFKDLQRLIGSQSDVNHFPNNPQENLLLAKLRNRPFWLWDSKITRKRIEYSEVIVASITLLVSQEKMG